MKRESLTNQEIASLLRKVAAGYELKKANRFKINAYENAAEASEHSDIDLKDLWQEKRLDQLPGIGKSIASHLDELFQKGKVEHFEKLFKSLPRAVFKLMEVPGLGPKLAHKLSLGLGIKRKKDALKRLRKAAETGRIRGLEGFGEKSEKEILQGLKELGRRGQRKPLILADQISKEITAYLKKCPQVIRVDSLGSLRRKVSTVGDIDLAVNSREPRKVITWFKNYPLKKRLVEAGETKARILTKGNEQLDLMVETPEAYGSLLQHFTGSKQHNIHLREIAKRRGLSLSEHGISKKTKLLKFKDEKDFYNYLDMDWIPPELREDKGEIEAAQQRKLPQLVKLTDIKGDLHLHSNFDIETSHDLGANSMERMVKEAKDLGYQYLAFSEHNPSISQHNSKDIISLIKRKRDKIDKINYSTKTKLFVFNSLELDIRPNGERTIPDKALKFLDFAIAAVHSSFRLNRREMTKRVLKGMNHPKVKILAHPTGRMLSKRESYKLDWSKIFAFCRKKNKFLEINASPWRLDLPDFLVREAINSGVKLVINTDSHALNQMDFMKYGVSVARRGWATRGDIINTLSYDRIKEVLLLN